jgi:transcription elongation factor SPT6
MADRFFDQVADVGSDEDDEELDEEAGDRVSRLRKARVNGDLDDDSSDEEDDDDDEEALKKVRVLLRRNGWQWTLTRV